MNYKKKLIITSTIILSISAFSQNLKIGVKGGITQTSSTFELKSGATVFEFEKGYGYSLWFFTEFIDRKYFDIGANIGLFQQRTTRLYHISHINRHLKYPYNFQHISFDMKLKGKISIGSFEPYFQIGPKIDKPYNLTKELEEVGDFNKWIYGVRNSFGLMYKIKKIGFLVEFSYDYNINKLVENAKLEYFNDFEFYQKTTFLNIGICYKI